MGRYKARCPHKNKIIYPEKVALTRAKLWGWSAYKCPINSEHWHVTSKEKTNDQL